MNIAILGGSFDPPHRGHAAIAKKLPKLCHLNQIWLIPCYKHPFNKNLSTSEKRFAMTKFLENGNILTSDFEIKKKTISYAINTLNFLAKKRPKDKFSWIIGTDQVDGFTKWREWQKIIDKFKLIVVPRTAAKIAEKKLKDIAKQVAVPKNIILIDEKKFPPIYASSTLVRKRVKEKKSISNLVPKKVEKYIIKNKLYL